MMAAGPRRGLGRGLGRAAAAALAMVAFAGFAPAGAQAPAGDGAHLGVASCAGDNCHGRAGEPVKGARVLQNEYLVWKDKDKHSKAYAVLLNDRSKQIAANLKLPDKAENSALCLDCHADNVPKAMQGPQFQMSDGVGCEACHGGATGWLGIHISGATHLENVEKGLYPTDRPMARAERCQSCHIGDDKKFVRHEIMGAGHPPMPFELDTYTAIQPAHFKVTDSYIERKKEKPNDIQMWAVGQAVDLRKRMELIRDPKNAPKGLDPELSLFDCQSCHHAMRPSDAWTAAKSPWSLQWRARASTGLAPGRIKLYDASAVMLRVVAARLAPDAAKQVGERVLALHKATEKDWKAVTDAAGAVHQAAGTLMEALVKHQFSAADSKALAEGVVAVGVGGDDLDYSGGQQICMALQSIVAGMGALGYANEGQVKGLGEALSAVYKTVENDQTYAPDAFRKALEQFQAKLPK